MTTLEETLMRALTHHQSGKLAEARAGYLEILRIDPDHFNALHLTGLISHQSGDHIGAIGYIDKAISLCPGEAAFYNNLGEAHRALGHHDLALSNYRQAVQLNPRYAVAFHNLANVLTECGRLDEAVTEYGHVLQIDPNFADAHKNLGRALKLQGRTSDACTSFRHGLRLNPGDADAHSQLGVVLFECGDASGAVEAYRQALEIDPGNFRVHGNLGLALHTRGDSNDAISCFREALRIKPDYAVAHTHLAVTLQRLGRNDEAIASLQQAARLRPDDAEIAYLLASLTGDASYRPDGEYIRTLFDKHAPQYDLQLKSLRYTVPNRLREAIDRTGLIKQRRCRTLDLGCGTGLGAAAFQGLSDSICGVDISPRMVEQAQARGIYQDVESGDLADTLTSAPSAWNLLIAADVFVYFGSLETLFRSCRYALRAGGLLAFSTECTNGEQFQLFPTGRFGHSAKYVERLAEQCGFSVLSRDEVVGRVEGGRPLDVQIFVLQKTELVADLRKSA